MYKSIVFIIFFINFSYNPIHCEDVLEYKIEHRVDEKVENRVQEEIQEKVAGAKYQMNDQNCADTIFRGCNHRTKHSEEDLKQVLKWIQSIYKEQAIYKPIRPPCAKLHVRKDFKCMPEEERMELIKVLRELYRRGIVEGLANIHNNWWPTAHKLAETFQFHVKIMVELEKQIRRLNPNLSLPYWGVATDFAEPERSMIWDYFGGSGNYTTSYCVPDGMFSHLNLIRCVRRQWSEDPLRLGQIPPLYSPEVETVLYQQGQNQSEFYNLNMGIHFVPHLAFGGWYGDQSIQSAPNDFVFYLWHAFNDLARWKLRLQNSTSYNNLTPPDYNKGIKANTNTGRIERANIYDRLSHWSETVVLETFQYGFGDMCYVYEEMIDPILRIMRDQPPHIPTAIKRLQKALPKSLFAEYYPQFARGKYGPFYHTLPEVGECNTQCKPIPHFQNYGDNENGRRQEVLLRYDLGVNRLPAITEKQAYMQGVIFDLNKWGYCTPYIASE